MNKIVLVQCLLLVCFLLSITLNAQITPNHKTLINKVDEYLSDGVSNGFSGSILIVKEGKIVLNKGYGMADRANQIPYTKNTVATIGSVTKQFTATAILKLVAQNKLSLTDPIRNFFKDLPADKKEITIHQLLTHSAGLIAAIGEGDFDDIPSAIFFKTLFATKLLHAPGSKYAYSNAGYSVLARIIELTSGQDYESFLNEYLFKPAQMYQTGYFLPQWQDSLIAKGYAHSLINIGSMIERYQKMGAVTWNLKGNGGIHSTPEDMYKWYQALQSNQILSASAFEKLTTAYLLEQEEGSTYYGYGWGIRNSSRNTKIITHNGGNGIYFHDFIWLPEEEGLIILFTNAGCKEAEVAWPIEKMIFENSAQLKPIKKNLHRFVFDFIGKNDLQQSTTLTAKIKGTYRASIKSPDYLNSLGYDLLRGEIINTPAHTAWSVAIFKLNVELFPADGNAWDSLGEAYGANGQVAEAIKSYQKALALAPAVDCNWCESSAKALEALGSQD